MTFIRSFGNRIHDELVLLAPEHSFIPETFHRLESGPRTHARWLGELQRMRGRIYLADGAVKASQLTSDGRHLQVADTDSWHLLSVDRNGEVQGCARYRHLIGNIGFDDLGVRESWLARCDEWGASLRRAVESEIGLARRRGAAFSEVGGWAIVPEKRRTVEALRIAMATYSLAQTLGGCVGISTATERHHSSSILRRIGGRSLCYGGAELPAYYDPQYQCRMEVLRFDSSLPDSSFKQWVEMLSEQLSGVTVIATGAPVDCHPVQPRIPAIWPPLPQLGWIT